MSTSLTLLELLTAGRVDEFNARRGARATIDLFAADLANARLAGADLSGANMEKADLTDADLTGAILAKTNLSGADLTGATLDRCVAIKARFKEAYLGGAHFTEAELAGADFAEADLTGAVMIRARMTGARFKDAVMTQCDLEGADISEARFGDADMREADLTGVIGKEADLQRANLNGAVLEGALLDGARLAGAVLRNCHMARARLVGADLTGADLTGADLEDCVLDGADLTDAVIEPEALGRARVTLSVPAPAVPLVGALHFDDPSLAVSAVGFAALWENSEQNEALVLRIAVVPHGGKHDGTAPVLPIPTDHVLARAILPSINGFRAAVFVDRPGGVDLTVHEISAAGVIGAARSARLGYAPVVKPVFVPEDDGFLIFGIGRQGALSVHRWDDNGLTELMRAPAGTYRGFCGRLDPVLLGKGGTIAAVARDGIGKLQSAPAGYPGRLTSAAIRTVDDRGVVALAWVGKEGKGLRFAELRTDVEPKPIDVKADVGALELVAVGEKWLLVYTREAMTDRECTLPWAVWIAADGTAGKPFALLTGGDVEDVEDVRFVTGEGPPRVGVVTLSETLLVVEVGETSGRVTGRFGQR